MGLYPEEICEQLMERCLAPACQMGGIGGDNMTVVLICFLHNKSYEDLVARCASSLEDIDTKSLNFADNSDNENDPDHLLSSEPDIK